MITTRKGQTIYELTDEFMQAWSDMASNGETAEKLCQYYADMEADALSPLAARHLESVVTTGVNMHKIPVFTKLGIKVSESLLAFITITSQHNNVMVNTLLGYLAVDFYRSHPSDQTITLSWLFDRVGKGKLIEWQSFFWWFAASKIDDTRSIFDKLEKSEVYTFQG